MTNASAASAAAAVAAASAAALAASGGSGAGGGSAGLGGDLEADLYDDNENEAEDMPSLSADWRAILHWPVGLAPFSAHAGQPPSPHCVSLLRSKPACRSPLDIYLLACWLGQRSLTGNFLTPLPPEHLLALAQRVGYEKVPVGSFIMREGMESDRGFLLVTGVVSVWERSSTSAAAAAAAATGAAFTPATVAAPLPPFLPLLPLPECERLAAVSPAGPQPCACALRCWPALCLCIVVRLPKEPYDARRVRISRAGFLSAL
jgi:hypothetical protein